MFKNKFFTALISLVLAVSAICSPVYAAQSVSGDTAIEPCWVNVYDAVISAGFEGSNIWLSCSSVGSSGTKYQGGEIYVVKLTGTNTGVIKHWGNLSSDSSYFSFYNDSVSHTGSGTYRIYFYIQAVRNGVTDEIEAFKDIVY